ncbi:MAG: hypothetical protein KGD59_12055 [Candidatus Heimdallarchaeota archaeon]|nr:hypothetical protein [Candidatus Heimdallarchaeota archaeon]MBY8995277.1 hypothetical protein [Candidatus Heimdallarchaeota archaeon]
MKYKITATALTYIAIIGMLIFVTTPIATTSVEYKYYWANDLSDIQIFLDGSLSEWNSNNITFVNYVGVDIAIGYDDEYIYVAAEWADNANNDLVSQWNKTGMIDVDEAEWEFIDGEDDRLAVGFSNGVDADIWIWTASDRTHFNYAYEMNMTGHPDSGNLPFVMNSNGTTLTDNAKPIYNSTFQPIVDYNVIPNGTMIDAWFSQTPNGSQTDVRIEHSHDGFSTHSVEFRRLIDTGNEDDYVWDLSDLSDTYFMISSSNRDDAEDMEFFMSEVEETQEWYDITAVTNVYVLGDAKIYSTGINNGTSVSGLREFDSITWRLVGDPLAFPTIVSFLIIIGTLAAILAGIFFVAGKKIGMLLAAAVIGLVSGVVMLIGGIMYQSWVEWFEANIFSAFEEIEYLDELQYGSITLTSSGFGFGFYTPFIFGGIIAAISATMLGLSIYSVVSMKKAKQEE